MLRICLNFQEVKVLRSDCDFTVLVQTFVRLLEHMSLRENQDTVQQCIQCLGELTRLEPETAPTEINLDRYFTKILNPSTANKYNFKHSDATLTVIVTIVTQFSSTRLNISICSILEIF